MRDHDLIKFYTRLIADLERMAAPIPRNRVNPILWSEIKEAREELARLQGQTTEADGWVLVPAIRKCPRCGKRLK